MVSIFEVALGYSPIPELDSGMALTSPHLWGMNEKVQLTPVVNTNLYVYEPDER
jgi:hypothetical protein